MKGLAKVLFVAASIAYPFVILGGLLFFKAPPRLLGLSLVVILLLNFLANSGDARKGGFGAARFWALSGILTALVALILASDSAGLVKLYPVLVNAFLLAGFAWTLRRGPPMVFRFALVRDKTLADSPERPKVERYCRAVTLVWCGFFLANGAVAAATALWAGDLVWTVYNGAVSYVLIGCLLGGEILFRKWWSAR